MNFADIRNHLYDKAEKYWWYSLLLGFAVEIIAIIFFFFQNSIFTIGSSIVIFSLPILARWFQEISKDNTIQAFKCRIAILYSDAFGKQIPKDISREIRCWVKQDVLNKAPFRRPYYNSKLPPGPNKLADIVSESAFWTYNLARDMYVIMFVYTGVYILCALTIGYFIFQTDLESGLLQGIAKVVFALISLVFTSEAVLLIKQYNELYSEAKEIYHVTARMVKTKKLSQLEIMQIVEGYNILLISSPPVPSRLYRMRQKLLNIAYKKALKNE